MISLAEPITQHFRLVSSQKLALEKMGLRTLEDVLMHIPLRYEDVRQATPIAELTSDTLTVVYGEIHEVEKKLNWKTKRYMVEVWVHDLTGRVKVRWFNTPYMADKLKYSQYVKVTGKTTGESPISFINPIVEDIPGLPDFAHMESDGSLYPIYGASYGISSRWFYHAVRKILDSVHINEVTDPIPEHIYTKYHLPAIGVALRWAHTPKNENETAIARKRFAFNEVFYLQLSNALQRNTHTQEKVYPLIDAQKHAHTFEASLPFPLTGAQARAVESILNDMSAPKPMMRLLEGDVGSGKTAVAALVSYATIKNIPKGQSYGTLQVAYMAPTEVLAEQLFKNFCTLFAHSGISIGLVTGSGCKKFPSKSSAGPTAISRKQLLTWMSNGEMSIVIGTHALLQDSITFKHLALVIIDEQHRFGTRQRATLAKKDGFVPHLLSMTATPIPRTLALTIYGDLDLTLLDEYPKGRKPVQTVLVGTSKKSRESAYTHIEEQLSRGKQAYVICPRVAPTDLVGKDGEPPSMQKLMMARVKSVEDETKRLKEIFPQFSIVSLHGKMTPKDKENAMQAFSTGKAHILVATSVVEVGVNVPNATIILIEGAERFGLSQLHQLRGRVLRSADQAFCYLFTTSTPSGMSKDRLDAFVQAKDGFALAELDLELRGAGELSGDKQWGLSDIAMEALRNLKMVEAARTEARALVLQDPQLNAYPALQYLAQRLIHLE